jgi:hypothetical protein
VQTHVTPQSRPLLSLHGINDPLAAPQQGVLLSEAYSAAGIPERFRQVVVSDGPERYQGHEVDYKRFVGDFVEFFNAAKTT